MEWGSSDGSKLEELTLDSTQLASRLSYTVARAKEKPLERCLAFEMRRYEFYSFVCSCGSSMGSVVTFLHNPSASISLNASTPAGFIHELTISGGLSTTGAFLVLQRKRLRVYVSNCV